MLRHLSILFASVLFITACAPKGPEKPVKTQLEIRQIQSRTFDVESVPVVMKSLLNVLQDEGYVIKNVALDLGFLTANKETDIEDGSRRFWAEASNGQYARWPKHDLIEATITVTEFGKATRVRANFQHKVYDNRGAVTTIDQITDEEFYREFFNKVSKGIFIQEQDI